MENNTMEKEKLVSLVEKYSLGGSIDSVIWKTTSGNTSVDFTHPDKTLIGKVVMKKSGLGENSSWGIYDTSGLVQMLSVLDSNITLTADQVDGKTVSLSIKDSKYSLKYVLADESVIAKPATLKQLPPFEISIDIDSGFTKKFLDALKAVNSPACAFIPNGDSIEINVGYSDSINTNNVKFSNPATCGSDKTTIFVSDFIKNILIANRNETGKIEISSQGLMKLTFTGNDFNSEYFLVQASIN